MDITQSWNQAVEIVKDRVIHPTLWRSLEIAVPVATDEDQFVVGFAPGTMHLSGHLTSSDHRNAIESALQSVTGHKFRLLVIDGATADDYKHFKDRQRAMDEMRQRQRQRVAKEYATTQTWDSVLEKLGRTFARLQFRQLPQVRGKYLEEAIQMISSAMDELYDEERADEATQRALARVLDRAANLTEVPASIIALELWRYRRSR